MGFYGSKQLLTPRRVASLPRHVGILPETGIEVRNESRPLYLLLSTYIRQRRITKHQMGMRLLGAQIIATDEELFDGFERAEATGHEWVVEYDIPSSDEMRFTGVVGARNRRINIAIDVNERHLANARQRRDGAIFKSAGNEFDVFQIQASGIGANGFEVGVLEISGLVEIDCLVGLRHSREGIKGKNPHAREKSRGEKRHK